MRIADLGAFGVQYYLLKWIADYSHESQETRDYANYRAWQLRSGPAFCSECQGSATGQAALSVTFTPNPIIAFPVGSAGAWGVAFQCAIAETGGVDVTLLQVVFRVTENATGRVVSQLTPFSRTRVLRGWSSTAFVFTTTAPLGYIPSGSSREATLSVVVQAKDPNRNTITQSASADIR